MPPEEHSTAVFDKGFARPGDTLTVNVVLNEADSHVFDFSATIKVDGELVMRNAFQLTNIKSSVLQGVYFKLLGAQAGRWDEPEIESSAANGKKGNFQRSITWPSNLLREAHA